MSYYKQLIILLVLVQVLTSCWARYRTEQNAWPFPPYEWNDIDELGGNENSMSSSNNIKENDLFEKFLPITYKAKTGLRRSSRYNDQDRKKKFLTDSSNIQGLWALPGRR